MSDTKFDYRPRNTSIDKDGNVTVRGKVVARANPHNHVRRGSFFTPKGTKPAQLVTTSNEEGALLVPADAFTSQDD